MRPARRDETQRKPKFPFEAAAHGTLTEETKERFNEFDSLGKTSLGADGSGLKTTRVFILTNEPMSGESQQISVGGAGSRTCWEASSTREEKTCFPTRGGSEEEQQPPADKIRPRTQTQQPQTFVRIIPL